MSKNFSLIGRRLPLTAAFLTFLLFFNIDSVLSQKLNRQEKKILSIVESNHFEAVSFLEKSVNINSGTLHLAGVRETGNQYFEAYKSLGFETTWLEMLEEMNRAGHLMAERRGTAGRKLLLIGHLDTVFEKESPFQKWELQGDFAKGPGTADMKGGNVVMLFALRALHEADLLKDTQIIVMLHGDEEKAGKPIAVSRGDIIDAAKRSDVALAFEGASGFNHATVARRGSSSWSLEVTGIQGHSSQVFSEKYGAGAIFEASRILSEFYQKIPEEYLTFNPGLILGGTTIDFDTAQSLGTAFGKSNVISQGNGSGGTPVFVRKSERRHKRKDAGYCFEQSAGYQG